MPEKYGLILNLSGRSKIVARENSTKVTMDLLEPRVEYRPDTKETLQDWNGLYTVIYTTHNNSHPKYINRCHKPHIVAKM